MTSHMTKNHMILTNNNKENLLHYITKGKLISIFFFLSSFPQHPLHQMLQFFLLSVCHVPYFLGPSPSFPGLPVTFPPVPDHFRVSYNYSHPFRFLPLSSDLFRYPSLPYFLPISVYLFVSTRFLSVFHIRIRP